MPSCDRPGCSEPVFLHYGFDPTAAVVWLEVPSGDAASGLCEMHAERLTPPKGWTIDDRRDPTLRLFRPGPKESRRVAKARKSRRKGATEEQDSLFVAQPSLEDSNEASVVIPDDQAVNDEQSTVDDHVGLSPLLSRAFRGTPFAGD